MASTYSSRIEILKVIAKHLDPKDEKMWFKTLHNLRKSSDIMWIVEHPNNPKNRLIQDSLYPKISSRNTNNSVTI